MDEKTHTTTILSSFGAVRTAAKYIRAGKLVAIPTETVYGIAADATSDRACRAIYAVKQRALDNPLIVHLHNIRALFSFTEEHPPYLAPLLRAFTPGPLTVILKKNRRISAVATCGLDTVAIRIPRHRLARRIISMAAVPIAAPSANVSGAPSGTTAAMVRATMYGVIDAVVDGGACRIGIESTIVRAERRGITILRPGVITAEMIRNALGSAVVVRDFTDGSTEGSAVTPGRQYAHYRPRTPLRLFCDATWYAGSASSVHALSLQEGVDGVLTGYHAIHQYMHAHCFASDGGTCGMFVHAVDIVPFLRYIQSNARRPIRMRKVLRARSGKYRLSSPPHGQGRRNIASAERALYYYVIHSNKEYARVFYSLCHFFDAIPAQRILAPLPLQKGAYIDSVYDRIHRAAAQQ